MAKGRSEASQALRRKARARVLEAKARGQRLREAWQGAADRQLAALEELGSGAFGDEQASAHELGTDLCSFWVGCWADAMDLWHTTWSTCLNPPGPPDTDPIVILPGIAFEIEQVAEAADPQVVPGVAVEDAADLVVDGPLTTPGSSASIPVANIRVSTYGSTVLVSLVRLGNLGLVPGIYTGGSLVLGAQSIPLQVTVT
jgi:hypothetical protein